MYYLGVDLGTSSVKILLSDKGCKILATAKAEYPVYFPENGFSEQQATDYVTGLKTCLNELKSNFDISLIEGISFSGQMHGLVVLDEFDNLLNPVILWNDNRTIKECDFLNNDIGKNNLIKHTGNICYTGFTAPKVLWLKKHKPEVFSKISKIMLPKDYLAYTITKVFASDVSDASGTAMYDVKNKCWSKFMLDVLGISESQLPKVYESKDIIGNVCEQFALESGLSTNTKVIIGGGDQAIGAIGTGTVSTNDISISLGTSGVVFSAHETFVDEKESRIHSFCHANGKYHTMGVELSCAVCLDWFTKDILHTNDIAGLMEKIDDLEIDDLIFLPYLMGERSPINDPNAKGCIYGMTLSTKRENILKAIVEGICFGLNDCLEVIRSTSNTTTKARVIGGGAKSNSFIQILADITGLRLSTINSTEGGGLGAIILVKSALENLSIEDVCKQVIFDEMTIEPNPITNKVYKEKFKKFKEYYNKTK